MNVYFKKGISVVSIVLMVFLIFYLFIVYKNTKIKIREKVATALIKEVSYFDRYQHHKVDYCFQDKQKNLICSYAFFDDIPLNTLRKLKGKNLIVAYDSILPNNNKLLLTNEDFKKYSISYPDSLNWIKDALIEKTSGVSPY